MRNHQMALVQLPTLDIELAGIPDVAAALDILRAVPGRRMPVLRLTCQCSLDRSGNSDSQPTPA